MTIRRLRPPLWVLLVAAIAFAASAAVASAGSDAGPLRETRPAGRTWLPPGADDPDPGPSPVVFPRQSIPLLFSHARHLSPAIGATCVTCHAGATTSSSAEDSLLPPGRVCDSCHKVDHQHVPASAVDRESCAKCHAGYSADDGPAIRQVDDPRAHLVFSHRAHSVRNIGCAQCHGAVERLDLATRDSLPRMQGCFRCHNMPDAASRGDAKNSCDTCHPTAAGGRIQTTFASGTLFPPPWLRDAAHTPDFLERHKQVAGEDSTFCGSCHKDEFCADCHDGRVRPRAIHPNDYLNMHPIEARMGTQRCQSCHREQSFCLDCHLRVGVAEASPPGSRDSGRFHPPKSIWSDAPARPGHHAFEAERSLDGCVSCHTERDCVTCHGALGIGAGFDPHPPGFLTRCAGEQRLNPRPCLVCHAPSDGALGRCR